MRRTGPIFGATFAALLFAGCGGGESAGCRAAAAYSRSEHGVTLVVLKDGVVVCEDYAPFWGSWRPANVASGAKSFAPMLAAAAAQDGMLALDDRVSSTIEEWRDDPDKRRITIRQLLSLSSGVHVEDGRATAEAALAAPLAAAPGSAFIYNTAPFQVFAEVLRRKLTVSTGESVDAYFDRRIAGPLDARVRWSRNPDGLINLGSGAEVTARDWSRFGELVRLGGVWDGVRLLDGSVVAETMARTGANPAYATGWWLPVRRSRDLPTSDAWSAPLLLPADTVMAVGAGKQRLYVSPDERLVIVRQGEGEPWSPDAGSSGFSDVAFLSRLLAARPDRGS